MRWFLFVALLCCPTAVMAESNAPNSESCGGPIGVSFAREFAAKWIAAWNSHDLDRILEDHTDDFEMLSPGIIDTAGEPSGVLRGKARVRAYWEMALKAQPNLKFELIGAYAGIRSVAIHYRSVASQRAVVEIVEFNAHCQVVRGNALRGVSQ